MVCTYCHTFSKYDLMKHYGKWVVTFGIPTMALMALSSKILRHSVKVGTFFGLTTTCIDQAIAVSYHQVTQNGPAVHSIRHRVIRITLLILGSYSVRSLCTLKGYQVSLFTPLLSIGSMGGVQMVKMHTMRH